MPFPKGSIFENESAHWPYVCELVRYAREPQLRGAWHLHARRAHGDVRPDDDDAPQRGDERQQRDDALARDASAIVPSWGSSVFRWNLTPTIPSVFRSCLTD